MLTLGVVDVVVLLVCFFLFVCLLVQKRVGVECEDPSAFRELSLGFD